MSLDAAALAAAADDLRRVRRVLVITGAGLSADSGLPTYRGIGGLYEGDLTEDGIAIEVALSGAVMRDRPALCWKYLGQIEAACRGREPNAGHHALVSMQRCFESLAVLTQNVDGFHAVAGQQELIEIHGNLHQLVCTGCGASQQVTDYAGLCIPPACEWCAEILRPRVVLFGEALPPAAIEQLERVLVRGLDAVISVGTSSAFPYIAGPVMQAARLGLTTLEINPDETEVSHLVRHRLRAPAAQVLPALLAELRRHR